MPKSKSLSLPVHLITRADIADLCQVGLRAVGAPELWRGIVAAPGAIPLKVEAGTPSGPHGNAPVNCNY